MKDPKKVAMGKKSRAAGVYFETRVRADLEKKGWIVDRWSNNVEFSVVGYTGNDHDIPLISQDGTKLIPAKSNRFGLRNTGFPDFVGYHYTGLNHDFKLNGELIKSYEIWGVECKVNGYLSKEEKAKCQWYLENNIFSKILIASKGEKRGEIINNEFL